MPDFPGKTELTRADMEGVIAGGGSVMLGRKVISKVEDLPSKAQLAKGTTAESATAEELDAQIKAMQKERDTLVKKESASASASAAAAEDKK